MLLVMAHDLFIPGLNLPSSLLIDGLGPPLFLPHIAFYLEIPYAMPEIS
jgi:hypothetical protein